ncbi:MAG: dTDP-4-dehydrorhamnose 3,5-epimerase [Polyangiaceae bacterium]|nr:dTDP-4-dehydrorhamnose 3,5-epimerase [Polyangiaceae bacterium]
MRRTETALPGVCLIDPVIHEDDRGVFFEAYNEAAMRALGIDRRFVQDNCTTSRRGVVRGLHWQIDRLQAKLVRPITGAIFDVVVDVRRGSPTFGRWIGEALSAARPRWIFVPEGFAHGFCVTGEGAEVLYKCSDFYVPEAERGALFSDPDLAIPWPLGGAAPLVSPRDRALPRLAAISPADLPPYAEAAP